MEQFNEYDKYFEKTKYIITDFDGTLTIDGMLKHNVIKRIEELSKKYKLIIVTGRPLSWCNMMINSFPLTAIVGENGAGYYYKDQYNSIKLHMLAITNMMDIIKFRETVQSKFPKLILSDDNIHRISDTAIILDNNYNEVEDELLNYLDDNKMIYKISNIHINIWKNDYNKLTGTKHLFKNQFKKHNFDECIYFGDSPNDEPMFSEIVSVGVNNINIFLPSMKNHPKYITDEREGYGFIEFTNRLINKFAYVTLLANSFYEKGIVALANSLYCTNTCYPLIVLTNRDLRLSDEFLKKISLHKLVKIHLIDNVPLSEEFIARHDFERIKRDFPYSANKKYNAQKPQQFVNTLNFNKLKIWELDYENVVYLDADVVILKNIDCLFNIQTFAAASNIHANITNLNNLNSGVFVAQPNIKVYIDMINILNSSNNSKIYKRTDQTFLAEYFPHWNMLSHTFNFLQYLYLDDNKLFDESQIKIIHYILQKPWDNHKSEENETLNKLKPLHDIWWNFYDKNIII